MIGARPMHAAEIAGRLGMSMDTFYRRRAALHAIDKMPAPMTSRGRPAWDRLSMEAWLTRHHPARLGQPANDPLPPPPPATLDEHRARFAAAYGTGKP